MHKIMCLKLLECCCLYFIWACLGWSIWL